MWGHGWSPRRRARFCCRREIATGATFLSTPQPITLVLPEHVSGTLCGWLRANVAVAFITTEPQFSFEEARNGELLSAEADALVFIAWVVVPTVVVAAIVFGCRDA